MTIPKEITVWACPKCGYWRQEKKTGIHQTANPADPRGAMISHALVPTIYKRP